MKRLSSFENICILMPNTSIYILKLFSYLVQSYLISFKKKKTIQKAFQQQLISRQINVHMK